MEIGIGIGTATDVAAAAREAGELGFAAVHCGEHLFFHGPAPQALATLAVAAAATERVSLVSAVTLLPLYPAAVIAKLATVVDIASDGRLELGLGVGGEFPKEFAAAGVDMADRAARADEALEVLKALFSGRPVTYRGRWANLNDVTLQPLPLQSNRPPLWMAGRKGAALRRAGRHADVWMPYMVTSEMFAEGLAAVRTAAADAGRHPEAVDGALYALVGVSRDGAAARRQAADFAGRIYRQPAERFDRYVIAGTPEECVSQLTEFERSGASSAQLTVAAPPEAHESVLRLLATEVVPAVA